MNGPQDLGGQMGFGPVAPEANEPVFHAAWERRAFALALAMGAARQWNIDQSRHARETLPWVQYLGSSYYEIWFAGLEKLMAERGLLDGAPQKLPRLTASDVAKVLARGGPASRSSPRAVRFKVGDIVRTRNIHPDGHTRLPRYLRGLPGEVVRVHGTHVFPDSSAHDKGDDPQWLYTVRFKASDVWGSDSADGIMADLWEPYLDAA
jgi:nitrile hydratase subunit beta